MIDRRRLAYLALEEPLPGTAAEIHVREIVNGLTACGWQIDLYSTKVTATRHRLPRRIVGYLVLQARLALRLRRYQALYVRGHPLAFLVSVIAWLIRTPTIHEVNGPYHDVFVVHPAARYLRRPIEALQRLQFRLASGLIAVTPGLAGWLKNEAGHDRITLVPNGANTRLFHPGARSDRIIPRPYVVFVGGLTVWHGIGCMIDAVAHHEWPEEVNLVVVGDGPEAPRLRNAAAANQKIIPLGRLPYEDIPGLVAGALAGLCPIVDVGQRSATGLAPLKLFESLASGAPVIASALPGQGQFVEAHGVGLTFEAGSATDLADCVRRLWSDPVQAKEMGERGAALIRSGHSWERRAIDTHRFIEQLIRVI